MNKILSTAIASFGSGLMETDGLNIDNEEEIINHLEYRVAELLDSNPELLMSYMYRLDVLEYKIKIVLHGHSKTSIARQLAQLIWSRQKERAKTKLEYRSGNPDFWYTDDE